jgi:hypothetical protein
MCALVPDALTRARTSSGDLDEVAAGVDQLEQQMS